MAGNYSSDVALRDTAQAVMVPLKDGIRSLNQVYQALIKADVDPFTEQCLDYLNIRHKIVQTHKQLQQSERAASSGLKSLDATLERLVQDEGKLKRETDDMLQTLKTLRIEQASAESLRRNAQEAVSLASANLNSAKHTLEAEEKRKHDATIVTGVGAGLLVIPVIGWIAGLSMIIGGAVELDAATKNVETANDEVRRSNNELEKYQRKVSEYGEEISRAENGISQKDEQLRQTRELIHKVTEQLHAVADFQRNLRSAVNLLGVLSSRASVVEHQTRRFILQESVMKVMEDVMNATKRLAGNELLCDQEMSTLIEQLKLVL